MLLFPPDSSAECYDDGGGNRSSAKWEIKRKRGKRKNSVNEGDCRRRERRRSWNKMREQTKAVRRALLDGSA